MRAVGWARLFVAVAVLAVSGVCWGATYEVETVLGAPQLRYEDNFDSYPPSGDGVATGEWAPGWPDPSPLDGKGYWTSGSTVINGYGGYGWFISADDWPGWQNRPAWFCRHMTNYTPIDSNWAVFHVSPGSVAQLSLSLDYFWMRYSWLDVALAGTEIAPNSSQWVDITQALGMGPADPPAVQHAEADLTPFLQAAGIVTDVYVRFRIGANGSGILWQAFIDNVQLVVTPAAVPATVDIAPDTLNPRSRGRYVTAYIELPEGYDIADVDVGSVCLAVDDNETVVLAEARPVAIGDYDSDGVADLMVKFDRQAVQALLTPGETVTVYVGGVLTDGTEFLGSDTLRVLGSAVNSSTLTFLGQVAQANEAACQTAQGLFDSLTSSRRGRGTSGEARRVLRLLDALLRRSLGPGLSAALGQVRDAMSDLAERGAGPSGKIGISDVQLYSQAGYIAYCFAVLGDCYDFERGAWLRIRRGLSSDFGLTEAYGALDVVQAQIGLLSEALDDFRTLAGALSDAQRAQQLTALADDVQALLVSLADYAAAERAYVDSW